VSQPSHIEEQLLAANLLMAASSKSSASLDSFLGWFTAGFTAGVLVLINQGDQFALVGNSALSQIIWLFLLLVTLTVLSKFLAAGVKAATDAHEVARKLAEDPGLDMGDPKVVTKEVERALFAPLRWFAAKSLLKVENGDLVAPARLVTKMAQLQGIAVVLGLIVAGIAMAIFICDTAA